MRSLLTFSLLCVSLLSGCGFQRGTGTLNDSAPTGSVVAQGNWAGQNGKTVSGVAVIYLETDGTYTLRLQNFVAPSDSSLYLYVTVNSTSSQLSLLRAAQGNQNYAIGRVASGSSFSLVELKSTAVNPPLAYGAATLSSPPQ